MKSFNISDIQEIQDGCMIWIISESNRFMKGIFYKNDGKLSETKKRLLKFYKNSKKINNLISLGSIEELGKTVYDTYPYYGLNYKLKTDEPVILKVDSEEEFKKIKIKNHFIFSSKNKSWQLTNNI